MHSSPANRGGARNSLPYVEGISIFRGSSPSSSPRFHLLSNLPTPVCCSFPILRLFLLLFCLALLYPLSFASKLRPGASNLVDQKITKNNSSIFFNLLLPNYPNFVFLSSLSFPFFFFLDYRNKEFFSNKFYRI